VAKADIQGGRVSSDVIIGHDGKPRCAWVGTGNTAAIRYHDDVWGTRTYDESAMFEALTLGVFEVGLSWSIVFGKRDAFRASEVGNRSGVGTARPRTSVVTPPQAGVSCQLAATSA
jgi:hypothetical protein